MPVAGRGVRRSEWDGDPTIGPSVFLRWPGRWSSIAFSRAKGRPTYRCARPSISLSSILNLKTANALGLSELASLLARRWGDRM